MHITPFSADNGSMDNDSLLFGDQNKQGLREWIYARYACGDPVSVIAKEEAISIQKVYAIMNSCPEDYEDTKVKREQFNGLRIVRSLALVDAHYLRVLEAMLDDNVSTLIKSEAFKELSKLSRNLALRVQLYEGKATEIIEQQTREKPMPLEEMRQRLEDAESVGTGLDDLSVNGGDSQ